MLGGAHPIHTTSAYRLILGVGGGLVRKGLFLWPSGLPRKITAQTANSRYVFRDEIAKIPLARRGCLLIIIGSGLGRSSVPQNLETGQRNAATATSWGWGKTDGIREKTKGKLTYHFGRSLLYNDKRLVSVSRPICFDLGKAPSGWRCGWQGLVDRFR